MEWDRQLRGSGVGQLTDGEWTEAANGAECNGAALTRSEMGQPTEWE